MYKAATRAWRTTKGFMPQTIALFPGRKPIRDLQGLPASLGRIGALELRLATQKREIRKAQKLRYKVFYEEGGAIADARSALTRRDLCAFDRICDHLIVIDHDFVNRFGRRKPRVVGCYRLLRQEAAARHGGFYSASEFDVAPLLARHAGKRFLELGRSCVHKDWRSKRVLELLWRGIWTYVRHHRVDVMIGCASLPGADPAPHAATLAWLGAAAPAEEAWATRALPERRILIAQTDMPSLEPRQAMAKLPPLLKGYLRVGAKIGAEAVSDRQFGTTDVFIVMPVAEIDPRYISYFSTPESPARLAA
jgi:putative hemolysin